MVETLVHGNYAHYTNHRCRCDKCRAAYNEYRRGYRKRYNEAQRAANPEKYGKKSRAVNQEVYISTKLRKLHKEALEARNGICECCGRFTDKLVVDHEHGTERLRGFLCMTCNTAIGKLGDSIEGLERALSYLRKTG